MTTQTHTIWMVVKNGSPFAAFTAKGELTTWLRANHNKGWILWEVWKLPNGNHPIFAPKRLVYDIKSNTWEEPTT